MSDDELIEKIRRGDEAAAEELIRRYYPPVFRYCRRRCGSRETAEDLTQETFLRLFKYLPSYRSGGRLKPYLFSIAGRLCLDESRNVPLCPLEGSQVPSPDGDPFRRVEDRDEIRRLLDALPPEQREAVILRYGERLTYRQIARVTGCTMRTAQGRVKYALKNMRKGARHA